MMSRRRLPTYLSLGAGATLLALAAATAQPTQLPPNPSKALTRAKPPVETPEKPMALPPGGHEIIQTFPTTEKPQTAWKVWWATKAGNGLYIQGAWFKRSMREPWLQVLGDARLAQAYVPYHNNHHRFWDIDYNFGMDPLGKVDAGPTGELLLAHPNDKSPKVVKEIRDRGLMYKSAGVVRRGETMLLWCSLAAGNYKYPIEYGFQDEGTITFRVGASGHNIGGDQWTPHMHNAMWRVDVNLGGSDHNSVLLCEHVETPEGGPTAQTETTPLRKECGIDWDPQKFTMLRVINTQKRNQRGQPISYDLIPHRMGSSRHYSKTIITVPSGKMREDECTMHDFWVTRADAKQMAYKMVPEYIKAGRNIQDTDVVLWYTASCHHEPRSEDGVDTAGGFRGATHVMWCGFDLRPRNIFGGSPFFNAGQNGPQGPRPGPFGR
jgi:primary-amine oxidase